MPRAILALLLVALLPAPLASADPYAHGDCGESDVSTSAFADAPLAVDAWADACAGAAVHDEERVCRPPGLHVDAAGAHLFALVADGCGVGALVELP